MQPLSSGRLYGCRRIGCFESCVWHRGFWKSFTHPPNQKPPGWFAIPTHRTAPVLPGHTKRPATGLQNLQRVGSHLSLNTARYGLANETHEHDNKPDSCQIISLPALIIAAFLAMGAAVRGIVDVQAVNAGARYPLSLVLAGLLSIACFKALISVSPGRQASSACQSATCLPTWVARVSTQRGRHPKAPAPRLSSLPGPAGLLSIPTR